MPGLQPLRLILAAGVIVSLAACDKSIPVTPTTPPAPATPQIRLVNHGTVPIENISINFLGHVETYGTLAPGATTPYHDIAKSYSYAYVEATVDGRKAVVQPEDFVGEKLLPPGRYTGELVAKPDGKEPYERLQLNYFVKDPTP